LFVCKTNEFVWLLAQVNLVSVGSMLFGQSNVTIMVSWLAQSVAEMTVILYITQTKSIVPIISSVVSVTAVCGSIPVLDITMTIRLLEWALHILLLFVVISVCFKLSRQSIETRNNTMLAHQSEAWMCLVCIFYVHAQMESVYMFIPPSMGFWATPITQVLMIPLYILFIVFNKTDVFISYSLVPSISYVLTVATFVCCVYLYSPLWSRSVHV